MIGDLKIAEAMDLLRKLMFYLGNMPVSWPSMKPIKEILKVFLRSFGEDFHPSISTISYPPPQV
jgi:hypothetical protein